MVNVRAIKNALKLHENVVPSYIANGYKLIKIIIFSSAATLNSQSCYKRIIQRTEDAI